MQMVPCGSQNCGHSLNHEICNNFLMELLQITSVIPDGVISTVSTPNSGEARNQF